MAAMLRRTNCQSVQLSLQPSSDRSRIHGRHFSEVPPGGTDPTVPVDGKPHQAEGAVEPSAGGSAGGLGGGVGGVSTDGAGGASLVLKNASSSANDPSGDLPESASDESVGSAFGLPALFGGPAAAPAGAGSLVAAAGVSVGGVTVSRGFWNLAVRSCGWRDG